MQTPTVGGRKLTMMKWSYWAVCAMGGVYFLICAYLGVPPDPIVTMAIVGALGGGHATANLANGQEHKSKSGSAN